MRSFLARLTEIFLETWQFCDGRAATLTRRIVAFRDVLVAARMPYRHHAGNLGRKTYELMKSYWPTDEAKQRMPEVAAGMEAMEKGVFSRSLKEPGWKNVRIVNGDLVTEVRKLEEGTGDQMLIMGSGSIISQLTKARLIDSYTMVIWPIVLGAGRTMFEGFEGIIDLKKVDEKTFANGNIVASYELAK